MGERQLNVLMISPFSVLIYVYYFRTRRKQHTKTTTEHKNHIGLKKDRMQKNDNFLVCQLSPSYPAQYRPITLKLGKKNDKRLQECRVTTEESEKRHWIEKRQKSRKRQFFA